MIVGCNWTPCLFDCLFFEHKLLFLSKRAWTIPERITLPSRRTSLLGRAHFGHHTVCETFWNAGKTLNGEWCKLKVCVFVRARTRKKESKSRGDIVKRVLWFGYKMSGCRLRNPIFFVQIAYFLSESCNFFSNRVNSKKRLKDLKRDLNSSTFTGAL
jgi:hypothetical protein